MGGRVTPRVGFSAAAVAVAGSAICSTVFGGPSGINATLVLCPIVWALLIVSRIDWQEPRGGK